MAILTTIFGGSPALRAQMAEAMPALAQRLLPDLPHWPVTVRSSERQSAVTAAFGGPNGVEFDNHSVKTGQLAGSGAKRWSVAGSATPDGCYALFRYHRQRPELELVADYAGSRTIWYAAAGDIFIASTSMRAIVALLGSFHRSDDAMGWFLSSGNLGAAPSWDRRIRRVAANHIVTASRRDGRISVVEHRAALPALSEPAGDAQQRLQFVIDQVLDETDFGSGNWSLALSGGLDCRVLLQGLARLPELTCVTWCDPAVGDSTSGDAVVARELARIYGRPHQLMIIPRPGNVEQARTMLDKFAALTDGRVDNVVGYLDAMHMWRELAEQGFTGMLRGEENFGSALALRRHAVLANMHLVSFAEYQSSKLVQALGARYRHEVPAELEHNARESYTAWRGRLRRDFELPVIYAALNGIRAHFLEPATPLLSRRILRCVEQFSDRDRDDKSLFKKLVMERVPQPPVATQRALLTRAEFLALPSITEALTDSLNDTDTLDFIDQRSRDELLAAVTRAAGGVPLTPAKRPPGRLSQALRLRRLKHQLRRPPRLSSAAVALRLDLAKAALRTFDELAKWGTRSLPEVADSFQNSGTDGS